MTDQPPAPPRDKYIGWLNAVKGLSLGNVLVIALLVVIAIPVYIIYKALGDDALMDRLMSTYEEKESSQMVGCTFRHVQARGGPDTWGISAGFAYQGTDRWMISVITPREPSNEEFVSNCEALKLIVDKMLSHGITPNDDDG